MKNKIIVVAALLVFSIFSSSLYADRDHHHHGKGLPHGLQKKYDRGEALPPGWRKKHWRHDHDSEEPYYGGYQESYYRSNDDGYYGRNEDTYYRSYDEPYYGGYDDQYYGVDQQLTPQDHVRRIIQDVIDLTGSLQ